LSKSVSRYSLSNLISGFKTGELSVESLINDICDKLEEKDTEIAAFLPELNRRTRLLHELKELQIRFPDPSARPVLFGIPIGVKDLFHIDGFPTRAGSRLPSYLLQGKEADCVTQLKEAGALILGKTVTTEFAYFEPGATRNPLNLLHTPGGSSSGSAAAVAAGFCPLALGTQTIGSIIRPAAYCGVMGFKPSHGRISTEGIVPFSPSIDQVGFFVNDVGSMNTAASIMIDNWNETEIDDPSELIMGIPEGVYLEQADSEVINAFNRDLALLQKKGFRVKRVNLLNNITEINRLHNKLIAHEFAQVHQKWFEEYSSLYSDKSAELIKTGEHVSKQVVRQALELKIKTREIVQELMQSAEIDIIVSPSTSSFAPRDLDSTGSPIMNLPWTFCGMPAASIPASRHSSGLISGLQIISPFNKDEELLNSLKILTKL
jgi:Asp-tRNA(Asn)/Glu-tRNA(Gln) amidotransferase A subunit family amidase